MLAKLLGVRSDQLRYVSAHPSDAERVLEALDPASLKNFSFFSKPVTLEDERRYLARMEKSHADHVYLIEDLSDGRLIGSIGLHELDEVNRSARLGCMIFRPEDRGKGHGSRAIKLMLRLAFTQLGLNKIYVQILATHGNRAIDWWTRLGFAVRGVLIEEYFLDGAWCDMLRLSILRREWEMSSET